MRKFYDILLDSGGGWEEEDFISGVPEPPRKEYKILKRLKKVGMYILMFLWTLIGAFGIILEAIPISLIWLITGFSVIKWYENLCEKWFPDEFFKND